MTFESCEAPGLRIGCCRGLVGAPRVLMEGAIEVPERIDMLSFPLRSDTD